MLITRAEPDATRVAMALTALGHTVMLAPVACCQALPVVWPLVLPQALVFTSRQAPALVERDDVKHLPVFPIGSATALAARSAGFTDVQADAAGDRGQLVRKAKRFSELWWCCGTHVQGDLVADMRAHGVILHRIPLYAMVPAFALPDAVCMALKNHELDAVLLMSAKTTERFLALLEQHNIDATWLPALCLSAAVAAPLRAQHWQTVQVASRPEWTALQELLTQNAVG